MWATIAAPLANAGLIVGNEEKKMGIKGSNIIKARHPWSI